MFCIYSGSNGKWSSPGKGECNQFGNLLVVVKSITLTEVPWLKKRITSLNYQEVQEPERAKD